ncbi:DUF2306 domain-containing protein [Belliella marina]|uniref:DUF2306 domain-containing protein n=1 Tax=Belliella marina TaxID=1644146 RepID=A0ABW4VNC7_9BACT
MGNITGNFIGQIHLLASIAALILGFYVLVSDKGTKRHKQVGYAYVLSMVLVNLTAFMIYRLFGKFGIFHWFAIISIMTIIAGLYPLISKKTKDYLVYHFNFMYWSVIGLYCALMAETFSRLPDIVLKETGEPNMVFYKFVGIGTAVVMVIGVSFYLKFRPIWQNKYGR